MRRRWLLIAALLSVGCGATGPPASPPSPATPTPLAECPLTKPIPPFVPPPSDTAPARPPLATQSEWYGTGRLWTMLRRSGERWSGLPHDQDGFGQKTVWWSLLWNINVEPSPAIEVSGRRLDGPERFDESDPGTNAIADFGTAMLVGISLPTTGRWEITATYKGQHLSFVALVSL